MYKKSGGQFIIEIKTSLEALPILDIARNNLLSFQVISGNMDDVFVGITGKEMREDA